MSPVHWEHKLRDYTAVKSEHKCINYLVYNRHQQINQIHIAHSFLAVNFQHSRAAKDNFMQVITTEKTGISLIQDPYLFEGRPLGITKRYRTFIAGEGNSRAAIVVSVTTIDALLIT
jgi:hypothetical protein